MIGFLWRFALAIFIGSTLAIGCVMIADRAGDAMADALSDVLEAGVDDGD